MSGIENYFQLLQTGDYQSLRRLFAGEPLVDDPRLGRIAGEEALARFVEDSGNWLRNSRRDPVGLTDTAERLVLEQVLHLALGDDALPLPVALAAEKQGDGFSEIRVYYSMWPLLGHHTVRPPLLPADPQLLIPGVAGRYHRSLRSGDLDGIMDCFAEDGYAREPAGGPYRFQGPGKLRELYASLFGGGGGILLEYCSVCDDGRSTALEYNAVGWGRTELPPQAGIAIYERGPGGLLAAARIYDDVNPPL